MEFLSPVGRLVQGSVLEAQTKDNKGAPLTIKTGPNAGQPTQRYFIAVAFAKTAAGAGGAWWNEGEFFTNIYNTARQGYPQHFGPQGESKHPRMAFKVMDGDGLDNDGNSNANKEGFAGHWIVKFSSTYAPKVWMNGGYVTDINAIKRGHFVRIIGTIAPNIGSDVPGVYINHNGVEFIAYGHEIVSGPNVGAAFAAAGRPVALPAGATLTPPTPAISNMPAPVQAGPAAMPRMPAMPGAVAVPQVGPGVGPAPMAGLPAMPGSMPAPSNITPNHGFVQNVIGGPAPIAMPPAMPAQPVYQMTAAAGGFTREQFHANGTTDEQLLAAGYMIRTA